MESLRQARRNTEADNLQGLVDCGYAAMKWNRDTIWKAAVSDLVSAHGILRREGYHVPETSLLIYCNRIAVAHCMEGQYHSWASCLSLSLQDSISIGSPIFGSWLPEASVEPEILEDFWNLWSAAALNDAILGLMRTADAGAEELAKVCKLFLSTMAKDTADLPLYAVEGMAPAVPNRNSIHTPTPNHKNTRFQSRSFRKTWGSLSLVA